jgi:hypothetical protein
MKTLMNLFFAAVMMVSIIFIGNALSSNGNFTVQAQTVQVKKKHNGLVHKTYRGGKYVVRKTWNGTKWVSRKVWVGTKWTGKKAWGISKKVGSRTKKIVY